MAASNVEDPLIVVSKVNFKLEAILPRVIEAGFECERLVRGHGTHGAQVNEITLCVSRIKSQLQPLFQELEASCCVGQVLARADRSPIQPIGGDFREPAQVASQVLKDVQRILIKHLKEELEGEFVEDIQQAREAVGIALSVHRRMDGLLQEIEQSAHQLPFRGSKHCLTEGIGSSSQPRCIRRADICLQAYSAPVNDVVHKKFLGDHKYVKEIMGPVDECDCLAVGAKYRVQILAIRRKNTQFEWFPGIATTFQSGDTVYYAAVHHGPELADFEKDIVVGPGQEEKFETVELMGYMDGKPIGAPPHIWNCVIGAAEHRRGELRKGALYFRKTFGNIAIHLIIRRNEHRIEFPGPFDDFQEGDRIFTVCKIASSSGRQVNHLLLNEPESLEVLLSPDKFHKYVDEINSKGDPNVRVLLPPGDAAL